jgi:hypothetical protein
MAKGSFQGTLGSRSNSGVVNVAANGLTGLLVTLTFCFIDLSLYRLHILKMITWWKIPASFNQTHNLISLCNVKIKIASLKQVVPPLELKV